jgi:formylglycine-generating enzyme required for sulfatase activity
LLVFIAAMVPLLLLAACGEDSKKEDVHITVSGTPASIHIGQSTSFTVTVTGSTNTGFDLAPAAGAGCAITNNTVLCVPTATGLYTLTVTAKADTKQTAIATLTVTEEIKVEISQDTATVKTGQPVTFTVTTQNTGFDLSVSPETGDGCVRTDNTIVCTPTTAAKYTLTVTATADQAITKTATFTAVDPTPEDFEDMALVAAGTFIMGCDIGVGGYTRSYCSSDARPRHEVTLTQDFYIGKHEVTQTQWTAVMGSNPSEDQTSDDLPVTNISWNDMQEFIAKLNEQNAIPGWKWDLPTEAQWEYAARGGNVEPKNCEEGCRFSGSDTFDDVAWYGGTTIGSNSEGKVHPVGLLQFNELGLYDMSGNVHEWVKDFWGGAYGTEPQTDPLGPDSDILDRHIVRGGGWSSGQTSVTVVVRGPWKPDDLAGYVGFRLVLVPDPDAPAADIASITSAAPASKAFSTVSSPA